MCVSIFCVIANAHGDVLNFTAASDAFELKISLTDTPYVKFLDKWEFQDITNDELLEE